MTINERHNRCNSFSSVNTSLLNNWDQGSVCILLTDLRMIIEIHERGSRTELTPVSSKWVNQIIPTPKIKIQSTI